MSARQTRSSARIAAATTTTAASAPAVTAATKAKAAKAPAAKATTTKATGAKATGAAKGTKTATAKATAAKTASKATAAAKATKATAATATTKAAKTTASTKASKATAAAKASTASAKSKSAPKQPAPTKTTGTKRKAAKRTSSPESEQDAEPAAKKRRGAAASDPEPAPAGLSVQLDAFGPIIEAITLFSNYPTLLRLRAVSRTVKVEADRRLTAHVGVWARDKIMDVGLRTPLARRIPSLCPKGRIASRSSGRSARGGPFEHYDMRHLRVLDLMGRNWHGKMISYPDLARVPLPNPVPTLRLRLDGGSMVPVKEFEEVPCTNLIILPTVHSHHVVVRPSAVTERAVVAMRYHETGAWDEWNPEGLTFELDNAASLRELIFALIPYKLHSGQARKHDRPSVPWGVFARVLEGFVAAVQRGVSVKVVGLPSIIPSDWLGLAPKLSNAATQDGMRQALVDALDEAGAQGPDGALQDLFIDYDAYVAEVGYERAKLENLAGVNIDKSLEYLKIYPEDEML